MNELESLASAAKLLNEKTDEINKIISHANARLAALGIGVEKWLERPASNWLAATEEDTEFGRPIYEPQTDDRPRLDCIQLGYAKVSNKWELCLRTCVTDSLIGEADPTEVSGSRRSLARANRPLRIAAIQLLPLLYKAIEAHVREMIAGIEKAKVAEGRFTPTPEPDTKLSRERRGYPSLLGSSSVLPR
jgi:hypothetical protein